MPKDTRFVYVLKNADPTPHFYNVSCGSSRYGSFGHLAGSYDIVA